MKELLFERTKISWPSLARAPENFQAAARELLDDQLTIARGGIPQGTLKAAPRTVNKTTPGGTRAPERTLVRTAVALLLQNPGFAAAIEPPHPFSTLHQPGIPLLLELIALCRVRREISTAAVLEHFAERDEARALQKLAVMEFPGGEDEWRAEFLDALAQLDRQTLKQRADELVAKQDEAELDAGEKDELRRLLSGRNPIIP
jgi:DNA primase